MKNGTRQRPARRKPKYATANDYQQDALRTRGLFPDAVDCLVFSTLEVNAEAGELANLVYKHRYQGHPFTPDMRRKMLLEIGDILWGLASACDALGVDLSTVMEMNIEKLRTRYPDAFNAADSIARVDTLKEEAVA